MVAIPVAPFVLKNVTLQIAADNYEANVSQVQFDPAAQQQTWKGLTPAAVFTDQSSPTWTCTLAYAQDWATPDSLSQFLDEHVGEIKTVVFVPDVGTGQGSFSADVIISPGPIGGTVDAFGVGTVTLGVQGKPTFTPPVVADAKAKK